MNARVGLLLFVPIVGLLAAPIVGWPAVVRLPALLVPALVMGLLTVRPWKWSEVEFRALDLWEPSPRQVLSAAFLAGVVLFWIVLTRFESGEINALDFTVYFDRPCFQTLQGRPLFVETAYGEEYSQRSLLAVHSFWALLPMCSLYAIHATPLWLLGLSVTAVVIGAVHVLRIMQHLRAGGMLASATALAFMLNDNTARTLNYGFHPEVLYVWFVPWMIDAAIRRSRLSFIAATLACVLVKEDAFMPIVAASVGLALNGVGIANWRDRFLFLVMPAAAALINLGVYYMFVVARMTGDSSPIYAGYWSNYGATPVLALLGMAAHPWRVLVSAASSGFFTSVIVPHLYFPLFGWRWALGIGPIVLLYGASANEQLRAFGIYYAIILVPFLVLSASVGALALFGRILASGRNARLAAAGTVLLGALLVGGGYSLRPWRAEVGSVLEALDRLAEEPVVLVQSGLYPHAGYEERVQLLTPEALLETQNAGAAVLLAPAISAYPFQSEDRAWLGQQPLLEEMPEGLLAVRLSGRPPSR